MAVAILVLVLLAIVYCVLIGSNPPTDELAEPVEDVATPYLEGLDASFRIQQAAWFAEQQIWAEAARHAQPGGLPNPDPDRRA
jgi:hypothetical protein